MGATVKLAVDDQAAADPGRPRDVDHVPAAATGAVVKLAESRHIGVIGEVDLRAGGAAHHRDQGDVLPGQVWRIDQDAALEVDRPGGGDRDAADLLAAAVAVDLRGGPVDHVLRRGQQRGLGLDARHQASVGARERDANLGSA